MAQQLSAPLPVEGLGEVLALVGDVDGDGFPELAASGIASDLGSVMNVGRVDVFHGRPGGFDPDPWWSFSGDDEGGWRGSSLSGGDFNADGHADLLVGSSDVATRGSPPARVLLFCGSASGLPSTPTWESPVGVFGDLLRAACLGDMNGDGADDFAVMAREPPGSESLVRTYFGSAAGPVEASTLISPVPDWRGIAAAGDVDGDGFRDAVVRGGSFTGAEVHLFRGSASGLLPTALSTVPRPPGPLLDLEMVSLGDVDSDGFDDVGLAYGTPGFASPGSITIHHGSPTGFARVDAVPVPSGGLRLGFSVACPGDLNGDGWLDLVGSGHTMIPTATFRWHALYAWFGSAGGFGSEPSLIQINPTRSTRLGDQVVGVGDLNGDGRADIVSSEPNFLADRRLGRIDLLYGQDTNVPPTVSLPAAVSLGCGAVDLVATAHDPEGAELVFDWSTSCPGPRVEGAVGPRATLVVDPACGVACDVTVRVDDGNCGFASATAPVRIHDEGAPSIADEDRVLTCLWPPNGRWERFTAADWSARVTDDCDPAPRVAFARCTVTEDGAGSAELAGECRIEGGDLLVRVRRGGEARDGRVVGVVVRAVDACGNASAEAGFGRLVIPHDMRPSERCR